MVLLWLPRMPSNRYTSSILRIDNGDKQNARGGRTKKFKSAGIRRAADTKGQNSLRPN